MLSRMLWALFFWPYEFLFMLLTYTISSDGTDDKLMLLAVIADNPAEVQGIDYAIAIQVTLSFGLTRLAIA